MPSKPAAAPTVSPSSDFEEDTLLPPPAPGMEVPSHEPGPDVAAEHSAIPEHIVDNPTLQGFVTHPLAATSDPLIGHSGDAVTRVLAELPVDRTQRMPLFVPSRLRDDETPHPTVSSTETLRMEPVAPKLTMRFPSLLPQSAARAASAGVKDSTPTFREQGESTAEIARAALSAASTIEMPAVPPQALESLSPGDALLARSTRSLPKISLPPPSEDTLPQLPFALSSDTLTGRLSYAVSGLRSLLRRRTQLRRLRGELGERLSAYDRALVQLGELAYSEHVELLRHVPGSDVSHSDELPAGRDEAMLQVQRAAERFWAKAQKSSGPWRAKKRCWRRSCECCGTVGMSCISGWFCSRMRLAAANRVVKSATRSGWSWPALMVTVTRLRLGSARYGQSCGCGVVRIITCARDGNSCCMRSVSTTRSRRGALRTCWCWARCWRAFDPSPRWSKTSERASSRSMRCSMGCGAALPRSKPGSRC
jgi:hypothetical protein